VAPSVPDALFLDGMRSTFGLPITPIVPIVPLPTQGDLAAEAAIDSAAVQEPGAPAAEQIPLVVAPQDARVSARARLEDRRTVTPRETPAERMGQSGTATATAFPTRSSTSPGDAEEIARPAAHARGQGQVVEVPTTPPARPTAYVRWQGYWWTHNPQGGWHYWDGSRWSHFAGAGN
jgi:hypothetical protein